MRTFIEFEEKCDIDDTWHVPLEARSKEALLPAIEALLRVPAKFAELLNAGESGHTFLEKRLRAWKEKNGGKTEDELIESLHLDIWHHLDLHMPDFSAAFIALKPLWSPVPIDSEGRTSVYAAPNLTVSTETTGKVSIRVNSQTLREQEADIAKIVEGANGKFGKNRVAFENGWIQYPFKEMAIEALCRLMNEKSAP